MTTAEEIIDAVRELSDEDVRRLAAFIVELEADAWDRQIEEDAKSGKLDWLIEEGRREALEGRLKDF